MSSSLPVLRRAGLVLGLLVAVTGSAWAQCTCTPASPPPTATACALFDFGSVSLGNSSSGSVPFTAPSAAINVTASIVGPNAGDFALGATTCVAGAPPPTLSCSKLVVFTPSACGPRVAFLVVTLASTASASINCTVVIPLTGTGTFTPVVGPPLNFPSTLAGTRGACVDLTLPPNTNAFIGPFSNFELLVLNPTTFRICFSPRAEACGTVTELLTFTSTLTGCPVLTVQLSGFACSFTCAIGQAGTASLTAAGRQCVLGSLGVASTTTGLTRCAALRCAECCAESDLALRPVGSAARASIQALLDQIRCLQAFFGCAPFPC